MVPKVLPGKQRARVERGIWVKANGKFLATYRDPGRRQRWREFATLTEARRWRAMALVDPSSLGVGRRTLTEVWEQFLEHFGGSMHEATLQNWRQEWSKHIEPRLGPWPVGRITVAVAKQFLAELEAEGVGPATRAKCRTVCSRVIADAFENGEVASNPFATAGTRVRLPQRNKPRALSVEEVVRLLRVGREDMSSDDAIGLELMFFLGLRIGEMAGLQFRDVDICGREIVVRRIVSDSGGHLRVQEATKTDRYRVIPVPEQVPILERLDAHIRGRRATGKVHLVESVEGGPIRPNNWRRRAWKRAMTLASIDDPPSPHSARRTTASLLSSANVPPATIQAILGHGSLRMTGDYIDVSRSEMERGLRALSALFDG